MYSSNESNRTGARPRFGQWLLLVTAWSLISAGAAAILLGAIKRFLPHDVAYLGMTPQALCARNECRIVHFMIHDRISFGGAVLAVGILYRWLANGPIRSGESWAWRVYAASSAVGFAGFVAYSGYGYFDTWHGLATLMVLAACAWGLFATRRRSDSLRSGGSEASRRANAGWLLMLLASVGLLLGGLIVLAVGMTCVFVPQDLQYMGITVEELQRINPRLIPLIAHDRAGFGGAVASCGLAMFGCIRYGRRQRGALPALATAGLAGFGCAIGVHPAVGYNDFVHILPALLGAAIFFLGLAIAWRDQTNRNDRHARGDRAIGAKRIT